MLHYKVGETTARLGKNKGKKVYFAQRVSVTRLTTRAVEDLIVEKTSLSRGDVRHAITSLAEVIRWGVANGLMVELGDLGTFKVDASARQVLSGEEVKASTLKRTVLRFYPRGEMRSAVRSVSIAVDNPKALPSPSAPSTGSSEGSSGGSSDF